MQRGITLAGISPEPDRRSALAYGLIAAIVVATVLFFAITDMRLDGTWPWELLPLAGSLIFIGWMLRRAGHRKTATGLETVSLVVVKSSFVVALQFALVALPLSLKDDWLFAADRFFGFDWLAFSNFANATFSFPLLFFAYNALIWQGVLILVIVCTAGRETHAWRTITAAIIALVITSAVFAFFPADGRYAGCGPSFGDALANIGRCNYGPIIHHIKDGGLRLIEVHMATGLVAMPSFHAAGGAIFVWAAWPFKWLRWPVLGLNVLMWISTITVGAHYMVDVPAGIAVAALSIWLAKRFVDDRLAVQK